LKLAPSDVERMTLRQLWLMYQAWLLTSWDHTAAIVSAVRGLECRLDALFGGHAKPPTLAECHPYRDSGAAKDKMELTPANFSGFKEMVFSVFK